MLSSVCLRCGVGFAGRHELRSYEYDRSASHVCKILESIIRHAILEYVSKYDLVKDSQHGIVGRRSCSTISLEFLGDGY
jgi:hypothetical protein